MARFNVAIAIRYTSYYAETAGWAAQIAKVCKVLGFKASFPDPRQFVTAVRDWQKNHPPLDPDGMLGPITWGRLRLLVEAYRDTTSFTGPNPQWIAKLTTKTPPAQPSPPPQPAPATANTAEDKIIDEMVKITMQKKKDPYVAVAVSGAYAEDQARLGVRTNPTGLPISQTLAVGQQWEGIAGPRIILALSGSGTFGSVIFVTDSGQLYSQTVTGWESDMFAKLWSDVSRSLKPIKTLLEIEAALLLGMCAATSVAAGALIFTGSVTQWMAKNKDKMPAYIYAVEELLEARARLKVIAPTLYDKIIEVAISRLFAEIPGTLKKDPVIIARFIGGMLVRLGIAVWTRNFSSLATWIGVLGEIIFAQVRSVPGAVKHAVSDKDLVDKLKSIGAQISIEDAMIIKEEVARNPDELMRIFKHVESVFSVVK